ncbi:dihydrofolate reductase [Agrococcus versicolor]|uniref:Dihydrofolate reductase n=1 Tax=Agrococcus versicolor TaxID=501482 RepID=A0ABP5MJ09_9MICO
MTQRIGLIWAEARDHVIGAAGGMPWRLPEDMRRFRRITLGSPVVMGRRTWESFGTPPRALPGRTNVVVTRDAAYVAEGATVVASLETAIDVARIVAEEDAAETIWIIGGGEVYRQALASADAIERTEIDADLDGDTTAPELGPEWATSLLDPEDGWHESADGLRYRFRTLVRVA